MAKLLAESMNNEIYICEAVCEAVRKKPWNKVAGPSSDSPLTFKVFPTFRAIKKFFSKSCSTVTGQWSEVTRPSADCQITFF